MSDLAAETIALREEVERLKAELEKERQNRTPLTYVPPPIIPPIDAAAPLTNYEIARYSRQLLVPDFGVRGQAALSRKSVLVIGAGGLGSAVIYYLAGTGVGRLGIVDCDTVQINNLHRQIIHRECDVDRPKAFSARDAALRLNSKLDCIAYNTAFMSSNALDIVKPYDIIVDASDNVATRYLVNDACVLGKKVLISGSAVKTDGQLTVYGYGEDGPCYRCLFPQPPPAATVTNCSDGGVIGVVPGIIGTMQALEAIKIASGTGSILSKQMLIFDALEWRTRMVRLRPRSKDCAVCGDNPTVTSLIDYEQFCGSKATDQVPHSHGVRKVDAKYDITCKEYNDTLSSTEHVLLDVRDPCQFDICRLPQAWNVPLKDLSKRLEEVCERAGDTKPVYCVCRRGNDSQVATKQLLDSGRFCAVRNMKGGITAWKREVDPEFPEY